MGAPAATAARSASIAVRLATSPPRCPPMPSATANRHGRSSTRNASSLFVADAAGVGGRADGRASSVDAPTSSTVSPTCTWSPLRSLRRLVRSACRSRTCRWWSRGLRPTASPSRSTTRACTCDTNVSNASGTVQPPPRPIVASPSTANVVPALGVGLDDDEPPRRGLARRLAAGAGAGGGRDAGAGVPAQLARDDPHDAREEQVQQREQAELEDGEDRFGHAPATTPRSGSRLRRSTITSPSCEVAARAPRRRSPVCRSCEPRSTTRKPCSSRRISAWWRDDLRVGERDRAFGQPPDHGRVLAELHPAAVGEHERAGGRRPRLRRSRRRP